jgi:hypothetical protein
MRHLLRLRFPKSPINMLQHMKFAVIAASVFLAAVVSALGVGAVTPNDTARFLAGMQPSAESPLTPLTKDPAWKQHAKFFDYVFRQIEQRQLSKIRAWAGTNLNASRPAVFYMFSGPDFLYADAFYSKATTYVLSGLEPVGSIPDLVKVPLKRIGGTLQNIESSLNSIMTLSFFKTNNMKSDLRAGQLNGTLPILYVFLVRSGKTIRDVSLVTLDEQGAVHSGSEGVSDKTARGVKIVFAGGDGEEKMLYYFSTNLANVGVNGSGFLQFCEKLAPGDSLIKSASYLLHSDNFSRVREFLLANSAAMLQDDSGIPLSYFDPKKWQLFPFGHYLPPIAIFHRKYQAKYAELFRTSRAIDFGIGYRWRPNESNLLLTVRRP